MSETEVLDQVDITELTGDEEEAALSGIRQGPVPDDEDQDEDDGDGHENGKLQALDLSGLVPSEEEGEFSARLVSLSEIKGFEGGDPPDDELVASVRVHGFIQPVRVRATGQKKKPYEVIAGRRRLKTAKLLGIKEVPAVIESRDSVNIGITALAENFNRTGNVIGDAKIVWRLMDSGVSDKAIAAAAPMKVAEVRALRDMRKLRPELIEAVEKGKMKPWAARMAARHDPETVQERLVQRYRQKGYVTAEDVKEERQSGQLRAAAEVGGLIDEMPDDTEFDEFTSEYDGPADIASAQGQRDATVSDERRIQRAIQYFTEGCKELDAMLSRTAEQDASFDLVQDAITTLQESLG